MGADPLTLARALVRGGGVSAAHLPTVGAACAASLFRVPFTAAERLWAALRSRRSSSAPPPLFLLGHWRSGTTHLYNTLARDPRFGWVEPVATGLPWDFLLLGRALRPLLERQLPADRAIDRIPVTPDAPQEDEAALANMQTLSLYHGLYFPRRFRDRVMEGVFFDGTTRAQRERWLRRFRLFHDKLRLRWPGRRVVIKNPVYTARVALIREVFPDARFIHIHRNPYVVFQSMRRFYRVLLDTLALQIERPDPNEIDAVILDVYARMMEAYDADVSGLGPERLVEVRFEAFEADPEPTLTRVYAALELGDFEPVRDRIAAYVASVCGYRKNRHTFDPASREAVEARWGRWIERWGYAPPA